MLEKIKLLVMTGLAALFGIRIGCWIREKVTGPGHAPWGPIGRVDVDAQTGAILAGEETIAELTSRGEDFIRTLICVTPRPI
jgi:hypothetical protein